MIANGSFLLNEASCQPGAPAAGRARDRLGRRRAQSVLLVDGSFVLGGRRDADALGPAAGGFLLCAGWRSRWAWPLSGGSGTCPSPGPSAPRPSLGGRPARRTRSGAGGVAGEDQSGKRGPRAARSLPPLAIPSNVPEESLVSISKATLSNRLTRRRFDPRRDFSQKANLEWMTTEFDTDGRDGRSAQLAEPARRRSPTDVVSWSERVLGEVNKVFVGQRKLVRGVLASLLAEGHVLIESVPGLGKTLLGARARAGSWAARSIASSSRPT